MYFHKFVPIGYWFLVSWRQYCCEFLLTTNSTAPYVSKPYLTLSIFFTYKYCSLTTKFYLPILLRIKHGGKRYTNFSVKIVMFFWHLKFHMQVLCENNMHYAMPDSNFNVHTCICIKAVLKTHEVLHTLYSKVMILIIYIAPKITHIV